MPRLKPPRVSAGNGEAHTVAYFKFYLELIVSWPMPGQRQAVLPYKPVSNQPTINPLKLKHTHTPCAYAPPGKSWPKAKGRTPSAHCPRHSPPPIVCLFACLPLPVHTAAKSNGIEGGRASGSGDFQGIGFNIFPARCIYLTSVARGQLWVVRKRLRES